ncbi:MAG TPA: hypothetical protein G4O08_01570 [Anaerolineae bacterium]|nr:hypothetical protein [Anaerolineae bacterium]
MTVPRKQASKQAPWRVEIRSTGSIVMWLIILLVVGGVYLAVNARMARSGRDVLTMESKRTALRRRNAELTSQLAALTAPDRMMELATGLGFHLARQDEIEYVVVQGYEPKAPFVAPRPPSWGTEGSVDLSPAYSETLGQWLKRFLSGDRID